MGGCSSTNFRIPREKRFRRAIKLYEVSEVESMTNLFNRNKCFESGESPLTLAAEQGHEAIVKALVTSGADANKLDKNGRGPLHIAVYLNDIETVEILLGNKADPNKYDACNKTPLHIACERGKKDIVKALLAGGANPNENSRALPPLVHAVLYGHADCVEILLANNANPDVTDAKGNPVLFTAISKYDVSSVECLLSHGADVKATNRCNETPMPLAALNACSGAVQALAERGCDPNQYTEEDVPPLIAATAKGSAECVEALLAAGVNIECTDRRNHTALYNSTMSVVDTEREVFYWKYFSNVYRSYSKFDPVELSHENSTRCAMSLVQAGANVTKVWERFASVFPSPQGISFEQMVLCEVLIQAFGFQPLSRAKIRTFVTNLLNLQEYGLIKLLYSAGVDGDKEDLYILSVRCEDNDRNMFRWVKRLQGRPRQLRDLCRKKIRHALSWNVLYLVDKLDIPNDLKEYLCIMDTEHYSVIE